jgi:hypothetical protein
MCDGDEVRTTLPRGGTDLVDLLVVLGQDSKKEKRPVAINRDWALLCSH